MSGLPALAMLLALTAPSPDAVRLEIDTVAARPGERVTFGIYVHGEGVAGAGLDIRFDRRTRIAGRQNGRPDCRVGDDIEARRSWRDVVYALWAAPAWAKGPETSYAFQPKDCTPGLDCTGIRTLLLTLDSLVEIRNGARLHECTVEVGADAPPGTYPLACGRPLASNVDGTALETTCGDGAIVVLSDSPTPTITPLPTDTARPLPTETPVPAATVTPTASDRGNGCQASGGSRGGFALVAAVLLAWWRSRARSAA